MRDLIYRQCSGVKCQQPKSTSCVGVAHEMEFTSPVLAFSCSQINAQNSAWTDTFMKTSFQMLELVLYWATLHFVGRVEPTPGLLGFVALKPTYNFAGVIAKCETQQRPISEPSPKSFYFDLTGRFFGRRLG